MKCREIWRVSLDPTIGAEIEKARPCVIVNDDSVGNLPLRIVAPITGWNARYNSADWMVKIEPDAQNALTKTSAVDCFQVRSVSINRFSKKIGVVSEPDFLEIKRALKVVFDI